MRKPASILAGLLLTGSMMLQTPIASAGQEEFMAALMAAGFMSSEFSGMDHSSIFGMGDRVCSGMGEDMLLPMLMGMGGGMSIERAMLFMTLARQSYC